MRDLRVNLIDDLPEKEVFKKPLFFKRKAKTIVRILVVLMIVSFLLFSKGIVSEESLLTQMPKLSFWKGVVRLVIFQEHLLRGEISDQINVLLLGMGGAEHEGGNLTDTIILVSLKPSSGQVGLLSIPRDLLVPVPGYGWQKINAANAYGEMREKDGGKLASLVVSQILDLPIHYFARIDFSGFQKIVDALGGLEVYVERSFVDNLYPAANFSYQTISFEKGWQMMNGSRALEFVRSRHGTNNESTDFARMKRQQKVILALKNKIEKIKILEEPGKVWRLFNLLNKYFKTNLEFDEIVKLGKVLKNAREDKMVTKTLSLGENSPLYNETFNGAYVLRTKTGDFKELAKIAREIFKEKATFEETAVTKPRVVILNGTLITGLARSKAELLVNDFEIVEIGNAPEKNVTQTVIYNLIKSKEKDLEKLKEKLAGEVSDEVPLSLAKKNADFVIILGEE